MRGSKARSPAWSSTISTTEARFSGPQLIFTSCRRTTSGGGTLSGSGSVTFAGGRTALDLNFTAAQALLLNRDDIAARVTGPLTIRSDGSGGTISGNLQPRQGPVPAWPGKRGGSGAATAASAMSGSTRTR